ncbi:uncharacterized protein LOC120149960 [Hibiscus syriacus]|uniref:uncharacterized protein LOC120149960 n=1 Tax=Hibiscus syriacus TaxID=106335 RepID=UPI001924E240|nr:uncharacterized protein LOC120149960 [Hibiscus syriacus]
MYRYIFPGILSVPSTAHSVLLTVSIAIIWNQLSYMKPSTALRWQSRGGKVILKSMELQAYNALPSDQPAYGMLKFLQSFERALLLIISNGLMKMPGKSLKEAYYLKMTLVRLLVLCSFLNYVADPVINAKVERFEVSEFKLNISNASQGSRPITMIICFDIRKRDVDFRCFDIRKEMLTSELPLLITAFIEPYEMYRTQPDSSLVFAYNRSTDIQKHCSSFLASASALKPDDNMGSRLKNELSFYLGDWDQETDDAPLIQFDDDGAVDATSLLKLASFEVKDVNSIQQLNNTVSLGGVLSLGISKDSSFAYNVGLESRMNPGSSVVNIVFEGVYMETQENGGERLMCFVGSSSSSLPSTETCDCDEISELRTSRVPICFKRRRFGFLQDDHVLLVLRYPKVFNLTQRAIQGEMISLNKQGETRYFSKVNISSHLSGNSIYEFSSELIRSTTFDPPPFQDDFLEDGFQMFTAREFCQVLYHSSGESLSTAPNYRFNNSYKNQIHEKIGPFMLQKEMQAADGSSFDNVKLIFQHVKCEQDTNRTGIAKVSAVLRAFNKGSFQHFERLRTGLSGLTLAAEGIWNSSSGQLFMVGCQGTVESGFEGCDYVIAMYSPRSFSIKQRSSLFGAISNVKKDIALDNPLYFNAIKGIGSRDIMEYLPYNYSKINLVNAFESRTLPYQILNIVKQWLFQYPALKDAGEPLTQLSQLTNNLALDGYVVPDDQQIARPKSRVLIQLELFTLGPLYGWSEPNLMKGNLRKKPVITKDDLTSCRFLNVSVHLTFKTEKEYKQTTYKNVSELSLEGLYDPIFGEMHLIACRKALVASIGLERGQDCLITVKIQYPPVNLQWWQKPIVKITIRSQRKEDDPLYFSLITIRTRLANYPDYFEAIADRAYLEAIVGILLLTVLIALTRNQLSYMKVNADIVPYISTTMLAFQFLGYSLPLIFGTKVVLKTMEPKAYNSIPPNHRAYGMLKLVQSFEKALLLVVILLTARLFCMVRDSRSKTLSQGSSRQRCGSREKRVMLSTMAIYAFGFLIWFVAGYYPDVHQLNPEKDRHGPRNGQMWETQMDVMTNFVYFVQDYFLLPQIISNGLMEMPGKSLKQTYYLGLTSVRLVVIFFDYVMDPITHAKVEDIDVDSSSNSAHLTLTMVLGPITMIMCAIRVYIQQNWKHQKHS